MSRIESTYISVVNVINDFLKEKDKLNMHNNLAQLRGLKYCKILTKNRVSFSAEILVRGGKYLIRLDYHAFGSPRVYIVSPIINMSESVSIHTFGLKYHGSYNGDLPLLCLTLRSEDNWDSSISLIESYIPWAVEWTEFYEIWLLTGTWYGKGVHPTIDKEVVKDNGEESNQIG